MTEQHTDIPAQPAYDYMIKGHTKSISWADFSQDGKTFVSTDYDRKTCVWDVETGELRNILPFTYTCLCPDGQRIGADNVLYDITTGEVLCKFPKDIEACSPDGRLVVGFMCQSSNKTDGTGVVVSIFDSKTGSTEHSIDLGTCRIKPRAILRYFAFSPDGEALAIQASTPNFRNCLYRYDLKTKALTKTDSRHASRYFWVSTDTVHRLVALSASSDLAGSYILWDVETGETIQEFAFRDNDYNDYSVRLSPNGEYFAIGYMRGAVDLFDVATGKLLWRRKPSRFYVRNIVFTPDSRRLVTIGGDHGLLLHDTETGEQILSPNGSVLIAKHTPLVQTLSFTLDGDAISVLYRDGSARLWNIRTPTLERVTHALSEVLVEANLLMPEVARHFWNLPLSDFPDYREPDTRVTSIAVSRDGTFVALHYAYDEDPDVWVVWDVVQKKVLHRFIQGYGGMTGVFLDNTHFAYTDYYYNVVICALDTGECSHYLPIAGDTIVTTKDNNVYGSVFSSCNGTALIFESRSGYTFWDTKTEETQFIEAGGYCEEHHAFYPDRTRVITAYGDTPTGYIRSVVGESEILLLGHQGIIRDVACSPDGTLVATGGDDGMVKVWDGVTGALRMTFVALPDEQWFAYTPEGETNGSLGAEDYFFRVPLEKS